MSNFWWDYRRPIGETCRDWTTASIGPVTFLLIYCTSAFSRSLILMHVVTCVDGRSHEPVAYLLYFGRNHKMSCFVRSDLSTTVCIPVCTGLLERAIKVELCRKCSILIVPLSYISVLTIFFPHRGYATCLLPPCVSSIGPVNSASIGPLNECGPIDDGRMFAMLKQYICVLTAERILSKCQRTLFMF